MNKQYQGSKKKARKKAYLERQERKQKDIEKRRIYYEAMNSGNIEQIADAMGIRLK